MALATTKRDVRRAVSAALKALTPSQVEAESLLAQNALLASPLYQKADAVLCYLHFGSECHTRAIMEHAFGAGKRCYVPLMDPSDCSMRMLQAHGMDDIDAFPKNKWGIAEPSDPLERQEALLHFDAAATHIVVCPGLAFDREGRRMGRGKGYYDRYLSQFVAQAEQAGAARPSIVGICLSVQMLEPGTIPTDDYDIAMDCVADPSLCPSL
jgi:5-formyltetrahydrofolate cyclo-ligase